MTLTLNSSEALPVRSPSKLHAFQSPFIPRVHRIQNPQLLAQLAKCSSADIQLELRTTTSQRNVWQISREARARSPREHPRAGHWYIQFG